jgi:acetyl-CoA acetyltransferase
MEVGVRLGIEPTAVANVTTHNGALRFATMALRQGLCTTVALMYGTNQRSNRNSFAPSTYHIGGNFTEVYGLFSPGATAAFNYRRRMSDFGATEEQLGAVAVAQSKAASRNPLAVYRDELTLEDYMASPYVIEPLRRPDFSMVSDGGFALILTTDSGLDRVHSEPVRIANLVSAASYLELEHPDAMYHPSLRVAAKKLWSTSDYKPSDVDALYVQDAFTPNVLAALENYNFCDFGTAHEWIQGGRIELNGELPVNVHGGQNRMTYMVGWQNTYDAVAQLRGIAAGEGRQLSKAEVLMCTYSSGHWQEACAMILDKQH